MMTILGALWKIFLMLIPFSILNIAYFPIWGLIIADTIVGFLYFYTDGELLKVILGSSLNSPSSLLLFMPSLALAILLLPIVNLFVLFKHMDKDATTLAFIILSLLFLALLVVFMFGGEEPLLYIQNFLTNLT